MKIGIITHYYKNANYGGCLQAYALQRYLNREGYEAEQICYDVLSFDKLTWTKFLKYPLIKKCRTVARKFKEGLTKICYNMLDGKLHRHTKERALAIFAFSAEKTLHSECIYNCDNSECDIKVISGCNI